LPPEQTFHQTPACPKAADTVAKVFGGDERNFLGPLMRFARRDVRDHIAYQKNDHGLRLERDGDRVRLITRNGYDWTKRHPWIVESALKNRMKHFVVDGEVILGVDGVPDFNALHSRKHDEDVQLYAFDILAPDDDLRALPLSPRKTNLARLLARRTEGIFAAPFEQREIGRPVTWALRVLCRNAGIDLIAAVRRRTGSRTRTAPIRRRAGSWSHSDNDPGKVARAEAGVNRPVAAGRHRSRRAR
jgi:hypothetical protein